MQQVANLENVARACRQLQDDGQKITGRAVVGITGGSLGTVLALIKEWRQEAGKALGARTEEIPADLSAALMRALSVAKDKAADLLRDQIEESITRESEALDGLAEAETKITELTNLVAEIRLQAAEERQAADKAIAVINEKTKSMAERIQALETERRQLIDAAEASRIEAAKASMQVERADQACAKAETRLKTLEAQFNEQATGKIEAEKIAAVADQRAADLVAQLKETKADLAETKKEGKTLAGELKKEIRELQKANRTLEVQIAGLVRN